MTLVMIQYNKMVSNEAKHKYMNQSHVTGVGRWGVKAGPWGPNSLFGQPGIKQASPAWHAALRSPRMCFVLTALQLGFTESG